MPSMRSRCLLIPLIHLALLNMFTLAFRHSSTLCFKSNFRISVARGLGGQTASSEGGEDRNEVLAKRITWYPGHIAKAEVRFTDEVMICNGL